MPGEPRGSTSEWSAPARAVAVYFTLVFLATMWPIYPFFSRISPMVWGMPFSLVYLILLLVVSFLILLSLFLWESSSEDRTD